ncbi:MAG: trimeric intracellular cation channel family protein [Ruminococcaceae bacterium]|nr:trimeric intracellular cation channel family protein [Oscillospiraceae bacterium]
MADFIEVLQIIGTIAFSVSGALIASGAALDIFGVVFVGCITAFGGGMIRDILLGISPPTIFENHITFAIAVLSSIVVFIAAYINKEKFSIFKLKIDYINNFFDAVGLAAFSVTGAEIGFINGYSDNILVITVVGMITGVGGGIMRDILIDTTPYVFKKYVYALASVFGSMLYYFLRLFINNISIASTFAMISVIIIRILATKYCWSLPKVSISQSNELNNQNINSSRQDDEALL